MLEHLYNGLEVIGYCIFALSFGVLIGCTTGRFVQRKHDLWMFGPRGVWENSRAKKH